MFESCLKRHDGITAVGVMTLQQIGLAAFRQDSGVAPAPRTLLTKSPAQIVASREKDDSQGRFALMSKQHLTTAAATDKRDYSSGTRLCQDGPIHGRCKSAACGSCWVGVLGGAAKLSAVEALEGTRMKELGYIQSTDARPLVRLACMARGSGNITIVVPPWNGMLGKASLGGL